MGGEGLAPGKSSTPGGMLSGRKGRQPLLRRKRPPTSSKESVKGLNGRRSPAGFIIQTVRLRVGGRLAASNPGGSRICSRRGKEGRVGWRGEDSLETPAPPPRGGGKSRSTPCLPLTCFVTLNQSFLPFCKMKQLEAYQKWLQEATLEEGEFTLPHLLPSTHSQLASLTVFF